MSQREARISASFYPLPKTLCNMIATWRGYIGSLVRERAGAPGLGNGHASPAWGSPARTLQTSCAGLTRAARAGPTRSCAWCRRRRGRAAGVRWSDREGTAATGQPSASAVSRGPGRIERHGSAGLDTRSAVDDRSFIAPGQRASKTQFQGGPVGKSHRGERRAVRRIVAIPSRPRSFTLSWCDADEYVEDVSSPDW